MALISLPNIPQLPGAPAVLRSFVLPIGFGTIPIDLNYLTDLLFGKPQWGLYDEDDNQVLVFDSFLGMRMDESARISSFAVEQGTFSSFNKVDVPFDVAVRMAHGGNAQTRTTMLDTLQKIKSDLEIYAVVMPEKVYPSTNLVAYSYERNEHTGPGHLIVDLYLKEVRQSSVAVFGPPAQPDAAPVNNNGQVQIFPVPAPTSNLVSQQPSSP